MVAAQLYAGTRTPFVDDEPQIGEGLAVALAAEGKPVSRAEERRPGVLVADDDPRVRFPSGAAPRGQGSRVWLPASGREALQLYQQHHEAVSLVLLDVHMPGLDGPWTLIALRRLNPRLRCCFMSGQGGDYTVEDLDALGCARFFQKPFDLPELRSAVRQLTREE